MKNLFILLIFISLSFFYCNPSGKQKTTNIISEEMLKIGKANWLIGDWQNSSGKGTLTESWHKLNDSTFVGKSYFIAGGDTLSSENIRLEQRNGKLLYIPTVQDQNCGLSVIFTLTNATDSVLVFENPEHDFPQKITYSLISNDSLFAEISAVVEGKVESKIFRMGKL